MVPNRAQASMQTSLGSGVELELHTEQAFRCDPVGALAWSNQGTAPQTLAPRSSRLRGATKGGEPPLTHPRCRHSPLKPDVLSLACQRGDPGARTYTMCSHTLLDSLTPEERALARQPLWTVGVDASFKLSGQHAFLLGDVRGPIPIISGAEDDPILTFDQDLMKGTTPAAAALLARVVDVYQARRDTTVLAPGHVLLIDNVRSVHGRSPFAPRWDGADRWILRTFVVRDLVRTRYARPHGGRVCAAVHS